MANEVASPRHAAWVILRINKEADQGRGREDVETRAAIRSLSSGELIVALVLQSSTFLSKHSANSNS